MVKLGFVKAFDTNSFQLDIVGMQSFTTARQEGVNLA